MSSLEKTIRRGFYGIGVYHPKKSVNIGTLWRSAYVFGAAFIFTIGQRYERQASDTVATERHVPLFEYTSFEEFYQHLPKGATLISIEEGGTPLGDLQHPQQAVYLLGAEDCGLPKELLEKSHAHITIPSARPFCLNVAVAGSIVLYDRFMHLGGRSA